MQIPNQMRFGGQAIVRVLNKDTREVLHTTDTLMNSLLPNSDLTILRGLDANTVMGIGQSDIDTGSNTTGLITPITTASAKSIVHGNPTFNRISDTQVAYQQTTVYEVNPGLKAGETAFVRELGIDSFNRMVVKAPNGKKYGIRIDSSSIVTIEFTFIMDVKISQPNIVYRVVRGNEVIQTKNASMQLHRDLTVTYNWYQLLSGNHRSWLRTTTLDTGDKNVEQVLYTRPRIQSESVAASLTNVKKEILIEAGYFSPAGTTYYQLMTELGFLGLFIGLRFEYDQALNFLHEVYVVRVKISWSEMT